MSSAIANADELFGHLPVAEQARIRETQQWCRTRGDTIVYADDDGLDWIDLDRKGAQDILVDWSKIACHAPASGGCDNRACDLEIYKQTGKGRWKRVLSVGISKFFVSKDYKDRFQLMAVTVVGGNKKCPAKARQPSGWEYCDALIYWRAGRWIWKPIH